jgi:acyl carrier protein
MMREMTRDELYAQVRDILVADFSIPAEKVTAEASFRGTLGMDSLDAVDLIFFVEKAFGYKAKVHDYRNLHTVDSLIAFVQERTGGGG